MILLDKATSLFTGRESLVEKYVENESTTFYDRLDHITDKRLKAFCMQVICSTIGDAYDAFYYIQNENNLFYQHIKELDSAKGQKLYKWFGFYHTIQFDYADQACMEAVIGAMGHVFNWNCQDKKRLRRLLVVKRQNNALFEVRFTQKMAHDVFKRQQVSPITLALTNNLFYNSHSAFMNEFEQLKIAL